VKKNFSGKGTVRDAGLSTGQQPSDVIVDICNEQIKIEIARKHFFRSLASFCHVDKFFMGGILKSK
jgi:hypothetical protein